ncbi:MAG TPA: nitroreductase/quinone reductase family protein [Pseudonocardiaceae bacterium]|nr:nitroreductase/quinone reductase family protein [Pseudonocardiaceae bacterium]
MTKTSILNRVPAAILSSPLHPLLSNKRLVLVFTGRRSGRRYATPVNFLRQADELLITTDSSWWRNLDGGAAVELRLRGRKVRATAHAVRDEDAVADALTALVRDHPPYGRWSHVRVSADGTPDVEDVRAEVSSGRVLIRVQLPANQPSYPHQPSCPQPTVKNAPEKLDIR